MTSILRRLLAGAIGTLAIGLLGVSLARGASAGVEIADFAYDPANLTVAVGDTVTWTNRDPVEHTVTTSSGAPVAFDSGLIAQDGSFSFTFTQPGTYPYFCQPHPNMTGSITVVAAAATPSPSVSQAASTQVPSPAGMPNAAVANGPMGSLAAWWLIAAIGAGVAVLAGRRVMRR